VRMRDLWIHRTSFGNRSIDRRVAPHGVAMLRISRTQ
jgi:hypothetical protein